ncbi:aminoglycoside phosphotransferase family protein [Nocardiopsis metallicus]|uniref:Aminoglycoside phosphotransferase (APT) family kinase protein n=1 Tax=Nocardiopsis metallicus TaxID=179819 RepID=A0A840W5J9_9ACTN|nr:aminoglycoside phosphotransferase family protein [Nocardiopsis metallicus]MBB5492229.1 aminoglycoside phosphotransferase (APT) family kinase protein [Nocardiopsis metallicus]
MSTTGTPSTSPRFALTRDRVHNVLTALCAEAGLGAEAAQGAELIKFTNNAVYRLPGAGMVVRIAGSATVVERVPVVIQAARWLAHHDAPTVRLVEEIAQPVEAAGAVATFWHLVPETGPEPTGTDLGRILKHLHALPAPDFPLPSWEPFERIRSRIADAEGLAETDRGFLVERTNRLEAQVQGLVFELPAGVIHGDPFLGNLIPGGEGPVICDFDSLSHGPREWDLVPAAVGKVRMDYPTDPHTPLAAEYGYDVLDWPAFPVFRQVRELKLVTSVLPVLNTNPGLQAQWRHRLTTLQTGDTITRWSTYR